MKPEKFTIKDFQKRYRTEQDCLDEIFAQRFGELSKCPSCDKETKFHKVTGRKCYACQYCGHQLHPLADTIFHKSSTSLKDWFYAIFLFANSKNGVSAKELERQLGVTYKTAWRMAKQIRTLFSDDSVVLSGTVEIDETYVGGVAKGKRGRGAYKKTAVFGMVEREGAVKAVVTKDVKSSTTRPLIRESVRIDADIVTDDFAGYKNLGEEYDHIAVNKTKKNVLSSLVHVNTIEGFWSQMKRSINGTYHCVSPKHLQNYVNEFAFRYNNRKVQTSLFALLINRIK